MMWSEFHTNPRKSYYLFLRQGYRHTALTAYLKVKSMDSMVATLQQEPDRAKAGLLRAVVSSLRGYIIAARRYAEWAARILAHRDHVRPEERAIRSPTSARISEEAVGRS